MVTLERPRATPVDRLRDPRPPRTPRRRWLVGSLIAVVTVLAALGVPVSAGWFPAVYSPPLPADAALAVGDDVVTVQQFNDRMDTIKALYGAQEPTDPAGADRFRRDAAKALATSMVLRNAERERGIVIPDPQVRNALNQMITAQFGPGAEGYKKFTQGLGQVGSSEPEVLEEIRQQYASAQLINQVTSGVTVRDDELPAEFPKYADKLGVPEKRRLSNIVVTTPEQARDILNQIRGGIPFADIARRVSMDTSTKDAGGDLGVVTKDQLQPGYRDVAFSTPKGRPFGPVKTAQGWNVGLVTDVVPGKPADFAQSQIPLKNAVTADRKVKAWAGWLQNALHDANIRYADAYRPADPDGIPPGLTPAGPS